MILPKMSPFVLSPQELQLLLSSFDAMAAMFLLRPDMFQDLKWRLLLLPTLHTDKDPVELVWMLSHDVLLDSLLPITASLGRGLFSCLFAFSVAALESSFLKLDRLCSEPQCVVRMDAAWASAVVDGSWCAELLGHNRATLGC